MIKAAIDRILDLSKIQTYKHHDDRIFTKGSLQWIKPPEFHRPDVFAFKTLTGLVDFIKEAPPEVIEDMECIHVKSPSVVSIIGRMNIKNENMRFVYADAKVDQDQFQFGQWYDLEMFIISLQGLFVASETVEQIIAMLGKLANEEVQTNNDDGFSQSIQISTGITIKEERKIANPVILRPWRAFREVDQPESQFIFRLKNKGGMHCALFDADAGMWKLTAMQNIKTWLSERVELPILA